MKWDTFYNDVKDRMVIESEYLHLLYGNKREVELQLSRWTKQGKIHRLNRRKLLSTFSIFNKKKSMTHLSIRCDSRIPNNSTMTGCWLMPGKWASRL